MKLLICIIIVLITGSLNAQQTEVTSPDGHVKAVFVLRSGGIPAYNLSYKGSTIINGGLGIKLQNNTNLTSGFIHESSTTNTINETYNIPAGKSSQVTNNANEIKVILRQSSTNAVINIYFRAYNDGMAFRYEAASYPGSNILNIIDEATTFNFTSNFESWSQEVKTFKHPYEGIYEHSNLHDINNSAGRIIPFPVTMKSGNTFLTLSEANITDYSGMYLKSNGNRNNTLNTVLSRYPDNAAVSVKRNIPFVSPWRVVIIGDSPGDLIESNLILNLNEPSKIDDSWVIPGKSAWHWYSGGANFNKDFPYGMNNETMKYFIDFASANGIEYSMIDGGWYGWFDASKENPGFSLTRSLPEIDLPYLVNYAASKNVGIFVWLSWDHVRDQMDQAFPYYESLGIKGVKIDFMNRDDQEMVNYYHRVLEKAAHHKLMVNFHGAYKPDGLRRTYPNLITREAVLGAEYSKWSDLPDPEHNVTIAFTRMITGPMDYTPGGMRNASRNSFSVNENMPQSKGTRAHNLAMFVVYESPLQSVSDAPAVYETAAGFDFIRNIPASWDETKYISGEIGNYIVIARRKGHEWYIGAMTDWSSRTVSIPLSFLSGAYSAEIYKDNYESDASATNLSFERQNVTGSSTISLRLSPGGGAAIRLIPN